MPNLLELLQMAWFFFADKLRKKNEAPNKMFEQAVSKGIIQTNLPSLPPQNITLIIHYCSTLKHIHT
ncbi:hypothetical protein YC2023_055108 [Brassica napus]